MEQQAVGEVDLETSTPDVFDMTWGPNGEENGDAPHQLDQGSAEPHFPDMPLKEALGRASVQVVQLRHYLLSQSGR